jgi:hypothetical protein
MKGKCSKGYAYAVCGMRYEAGMSRQQAPLCDVFEMNCYFLTNKETALGQEKAGNRI